MTRTSLIPAIIASFWLSCMTPAPCHGQKGKFPQREKIFTGGGLGLQFGTYTTLIDISPVIGYYITDDLAAGIGLTYKYYRFRDYYYNLENKSLHELRTHMYGGSVFLRYFLSGLDIPVIRNMYLHGEVEPLIFSLDYKMDINGTFMDPFGNLYRKERDFHTLTGLFGGGGYMQPIGERSFLYLQLLYNFNEELYSPYDNPLFRIGVSVGL